jgi:hypothetical protein
MTEQLVERTPLDIWMIILDLALELEHILGPACSVLDKIHFHPRHPYREYTTRWLSLALVCKTWLYYLRPCAHLVVQIGLLGPSPRMGHRVPVLGPLNEFPSQGTLTNTKIMYYQPVLSHLRHRDLSRCLIWTPKLQTLVLIGQSSFSARIPICSMLYHCVPLLSLHRLEIDYAELGRIPECDLFETITRLFPVLSRLSIKSCILSPPATHSLRLYRLESLTLLTTGRFDYQIPTWDLPSLRCLEFGASMSPRGHSVMHELFVLRQVVQDLGKRLRYLALELVYAPRNTLLCEVDWIRDLPELSSLFVEFADPDSAALLAAIPPAHPLSHIWVLPHNSGVRISELLRIPSGIHRTICVQGEHAITLKGLEAAVGKMGVPNVTVEGSGSKNNYQ